MSTSNNPNMDNIQNSPQFQEAVKTAVEKALSDFFDKNEVEIEEKPQGCPYLRPVSPPHWKTCTERELADPNKEKCIPPFWLMRHHFQNYQSPCCCNHQECPRHWNPPPCRDYDSHCPREWKPWWFNRNTSNPSNPQQPPREWSPPWWSNRNADGANRFDEHSKPQAPREWGPWWSNRNNDGPGRSGDNSNPQPQPPREWSPPWWSNRNADGANRFDEHSKPQAHREWGSWWSNRNNEGSGRSGDNSNPQQQAPREWSPWWSK